MKEIAGVPSVALVEMLKAHNIESKSCVKQMAYLLLYKTAAFLHHLGWHAVCIGVKHIIEKSLYFHES